MDEKNLHAGHRKRMMKKYLEHGIECFEEHEILEMLLFLVFSRCNTNDISHRLIDRFCSVNGVLSADKAELTEIGSVGDTAATYLCFLGDFFRWLPTRRIKKVQLNTPQKIIEYCEPIFSFATREMTYIFMLDARQYLISQTRLDYGSPDSTTISANEIIRNAVILNSKNVVLAHNHPMGSPLPSAADINATRNIYNALREVNVTLVDHIIISPQNGNAGYSMRSSELLRDIWN